MAFSTVLEAFPECIGMASVSESKIQIEQERRRRLRAQVHWGLTLHAHADGSAVETRTENVSSEGFYFLSEHPAIPGQVIHCTMMVPWHGGAGEGPLCLQCQARVVRVQPESEAGRFGIGCRIERYSATVLGAGSIV